MTVETHPNPIATLAPKSQAQPRVLTDASGIVFLAPESMRSKVVHALTRLAQRGQPHIDARGERTMISTRFALHLSEQRRSHLWSVLSRVGSDMQSAARERIKHVRAALVVTSVLSYGLLLVPATLSLPAAIPACLAVLGMVCVVGSLVAHKVIDPPWRERRRILLAHRRCPCCLASIEVPAREKHASADVNRSGETMHTIECPTCANAWLVAEIPAFAQTQTRCAGCGYDTCTSPNCPECGNRADALRRAG
ncbi:MAG: hypothetical protein U0640_03185 [Phycisphaerales bacterium]